MKPADAANRRPCAEPPRRSAYACAVLTIGAVGVALVTACTKETPESLIRAAERHISAHDYRTAQIELRNAIQLAPKSGVGHRLLGMEFLRAGDSAAAERSLRKALALGERPDDVWPALALALVRQGQADRLIGEIATYMPQTPAATASFQASLGQAWLMRGDVEHAGDAFAAALTAVPGYSRARLGQAGIAAQAGKFADAASVVDEIVAADPQFVEAHAFKGQLLLSQGQRAEASASLEKAIAIDPNYTPARVALVSMWIDDRQYDKAQAVLDGADARLLGDMRLIYLRGLLALHKGDVPKARDEVSKLLRGAPDHVLTLTLAGDIELRSGNLTLAEEFIQKALRSNPTSSTARRLLAVTFLREGRPGKAVDTLEPLLRQIEPKDTGLMMLAGEAFLASGDVTRASSYFESSKSDAASEAAARIKLGQIAMARGDVERGLGELRAASDLEAEHYEADLLLFASHLRRHETASALAVAERIIAKRPRNPLGFVLAGTAQLAAKDLASARRRFDEGLAIQSDYLPALHGLADVDTAEGHADAAKRRYEALITKNPKDEQLLVALAALQDRTGAVAEAGATLRRAITAKPQSPTPYAALVQYHLRHNDRKAAVAVAQDGAAANPAQPRFVELLGNTHEAVGSSDEAIKAFQELSRLEPQSLAPLLRLAAMQRRLRDFGGTARTLALAQQRAPDNDGIALELVAAYLAAARPDEAFGVAQAMQLRKPDAPVGRILEGDVQAYRRHWPEAERAYRAALASRPDSIAIAIRLCQLLAASGRADRSAAYAAEWISRHPTDVQMRMYVAGTALSAKDYRTAASQYEKVLNQTPDSAAALNNLAWALGQLHDPKALQFAERAVALAPNSPQMLDTLGMLLLERGDTSKALEYLTRMRLLAPDRKDLRLHYATALLRIGRTDEGKVELRELASAPEDFPGKAAIPALLGKP